MTDEFNSVFSTIVIVSKKLASCVSMVPMIKDAIDVS